MMLTPIEVVLVGMIIVQLLLNHWRKTSCDERVQQVENESRRQIIGAYTQVHRHAFELYKAAIMDGKEIKKQKDRPDA
jgi:hypothetical protein